MTAMEVLRSPFPGEQFPFAGEAVVDKVEQGSGDEDDRRRVMDRRGR